MPEGKTLPEEAKEFLDVAFSLGIFSIKDYVYKLEANTENEEEVEVVFPNQYSPDSRIMLKYTITSFFAVILRVIFKMICEILNFQLPNEIQTVALVSLTTLTTLLFFRGFLTYFYAPLITNMLLIAVIVWDYYEFNINSVSSINSGLTLILGIILGYLYNKRGFAAEQNLKKFRSKETISRKIRAKSFPKAFPSGWYRLFSSNEILPGEVKHIQALGREFAVFRGKQNGEVSITDANCPHLGANLGLGGKVIGNNLVCPFHGKLL
ncbi:hypothetical protein HK099_001404 [Clydaea vesicula]|uniref:Rieske domain-containing protein n=1 Tax=Clydaea vesicula TaxID=447962 RepID=A0AAD5XSD6_9FUNG|nr:hypothetical protein HK099_001404 [Clydaea vesicula]